MNIRLIPASAAALLTMLGCSSPTAKEAPPSAMAITPTQPQLNVQRLVIPRPDAPLAEFKACQLGKSCLALDSRPFEPCLLSSTHCADKVREPLLVDAPTKNSTPPEITQTRAGK